MFFDLFRRDPDLKTLKAGARLFREGEAGDLMYVLVAGRADILVGDRVVEEAAAGTIVGEMALIEKAPRSATVVAVTDCVFAEINARRFDFLVTETPRFAIAVMQVIAQRLRNTDYLLKSAR